MGIFDRWHQTGDQFQEHPQRQGGRQPYSNAQRQDERQWLGPVVTGADRWLGRVVNAPQNAQPFGGSAVRNPQLYRGRAYTPHPNGGATRQNGRNEPTRQGSFLENMARWFWQGGANQNTQPPQRQEQAKNTFYRPAQPPQNVRPQPKPAVGGQYFAQPRGPFPPQNQPQQRGPFPPQTQPQQRGPFPPQTQQQQAPQKRVFPPEVSFEPVSEALLRQFGQQSAATQNAAIPPMKAEPVKQPPPDSGFPIQLADFIQSEKNAALFYKHLSGIANSNTHREFFNRISEESDRVSQQYNTLYQAHTGYPLQTQGIPCGGGILFADGVRLAIQEEDKTLNALTRFREQSADRTHHDFYDRVRAKKSGDIDMMHAILADS